MSHVLGVDLGGTKTAVGVVDRDGTLLARAEQPTPARAGAEAVLQTVIDLSRGILADPVLAGLPPVGAVGIGAAGIIDSRTGTVLSATDALPGWAGTALQARVSDALGLPTTTLNDVHAHALGEAWTGAARGAGSLLMVAVGTGIGGAIVLDGTLWPGTHFAAGHVGHVPSPEAEGLLCTCGRTGHLEAIAAGPALPLAYTRAGGEGAGTSQPSTGREVAALAAAGDTLARTTIETAGFALGRAIGGLVNSVDPDLVVVGGGLAQSSTLWWDAVTAGVAHDTLPSLAHCPVLPAALGADAAIIGAARAALNSANLNPSEAHE